MNDNQVLEQLAQTDIYAPGTLMPTSAWSRETALSEIERRMGMEPRKPTSQPTTASSAPQGGDLSTPTVPDRTLDTLREPTPAPRQPRRLLVAAAAAALVLIAGLGTLALVGGDPTDAAAEPEVEVVLAAIDARNRGDIDTYQASLTGQLLADETDPDAYDEALSYALPTTDLVNCRVTGMAAAGESIVECESTDTDDYYGAGGVVESGTTTFLVTVGHKISSRDTVSSEEDVPWEATELGMFNLAFWSWLMDAHPAVFDEIGPVPANLYSLPGLDDLFLSDRHQPDEMLVALDYVDEFVAQSGVYPISR